MLGIALLLLLIGLGAAVMGKIQIKCKIGLVIMKYLLFVIVGLIVLIYFRQQKKVVKRKPAQKPRGTKQPIGHAICPYCKGVLENSPKRNKKCPKCQSKIMVRGGKLLTEKQAEQYDRRKLEQIAKSITKQNIKALNNYKKSGEVKYVEIIAAGNSCNACLALDGKRLRLKDELKNPTLPIKNCNGPYGYCRCTYVPVIK